jgi:hypothetical protein
LFPKVKKQENLEAAFVTNCVPRNLLLEHDGFIYADRTHFPNGTGDSLEYTFATSDFNADQDLLIF